jgi:membrane protease subunit (stomatin/prohibitin family)
MSLRSFLEQQFIDVIHWTESDTGVLAFRFPMSNMEIQSGAQLTVRESQMAVFVNEGRIADVFGPGLYTLTARTLPLLTELKNWDKEFQSPFKSDVFFFSTRLQMDQKWGTQPPSFAKRNLGRCGCGPAASIPTASPTRACSSPT